MPYRFSQMSRVFFNENWRQWAIRALALGWVLFLVSFFFVERGSSSHKFLWVGVLLPLPFAITLQKLRQFHQSRLVNFWFLLLIYLLSSFLWADRRHNVEFYQLLKYAVYLYGYFLATFVVFESSPAIERELLRWAPIAIACIAMIQIVLFYQSHHFPNERMPGIGRLINPIHFGVVAAAFTLAGLLGFHRQPLALRIALILAAVVNCLAIYLCQSRAALLTIALLIPYSLLFSRRLLPFLLGGLAICFAIALSLDFNTLLERGLSLRPQIWAAQLARLNECYWLIGCGLGIEEKVAIGPSLNFNTHSVYLGWLLHGGVIGFGGYMIFLAALIFQGIRCGAHAWTLLTLVGMGATLTAGNHVLMKYPDQYWMVLIIPIAILLAKVASAKSVAAHSP